MVYEQEAELAKIGCSWLQLSRLALLAAVRVVRARFCSDAGGGPSAPNNLKTLRVAKLADSCGGRKERRTTMCR